MQKVSGNAEEFGEEVGRIFYVLMKFVFTIYDI